MRQSIFYSLFLGYILGIFFSSCFGVVFIFLFLLCIISLSFIIPTLLSKTYYSQSELQQYSLFFLISCVMLMLGLGGMRYAVFVSQKGDPRLEAFANEVVTVEGVITEEPDHREKTTRFIVTLDTLNQTEGEDKNVSAAKIKKTKIIITESAFSSLQYGDKISLKGKLEEPQNFAGDNGREFDYISYLAKDKIFYEMDFPKAALISKHQGNKIKEFLLNVKSAFIEKLNEYIPFPESGLAAGLIVAGKRALPSAIQNDFLKSGTLQVVVLSGYNMTVVAETLGAVFAFLPETVALGLSALGIICFTLMAGATATVLRASIMALIVILATLLKRSYNITRALLVTAFIMLLLNPMLLVFDPSFQLSFLSIIGLVYFSPIISKYFSFVPEKFKLRETVIATVATQLFVLPFLLYLTGQVSVVALPANLLIFLFLPVTMLACFIAGMLGFLIPFLAPLFGFISFVLLWYELLIVHFFGNLPFASFTITSFPVWLLAVSYLGFSVLFYRFYNVKI